MKLTREEDKSLRNYAKWYNSELGEDAYHEVVCSVLKNPPKYEITNVRAFFIHAIKRAVQKMVRHLQVDFLYVSAWKFDDRPPGWGPSQHEACRKGHPYTKETIVYKGNNRTCRICKRMNDIKTSKAYRERKKLKVEV